MITPADDLPLHQTSRAFRDPGTDRNAYDRFFFNGYPTDPAQGLYFALAMGQYPGRNVKDAAFSFIVDGVQHNVRASDLLGADRLDTSVGPIAVTIEEPLRRLRIRIDDADSGLSADLLFVARGPAFEELPYRWGAGHRTQFDYTRLTQNGTWEGFVGVGDRRVEVTPDAWWGTRDRSWGTRPLGPRDPDAPDGDPGFYWLWAPLQFDDASYLFDVNELPDGTRWHAEVMRSASGAGLGGGDPLEAVTEHGRAEYEIVWQPGTRRASAFTLTLTFPSGTETIVLEPFAPFTMCGIGYLHMTEGHGTWLGEGFTNRESWTVSEVDPAMPWNFHIQAPVRATRSSDGKVGTGILEQLVVGPHAPSGFQDLFDLA